MQRLKLYVTCFIESTLRVNPIFHNILRLFDVLPNFLFTTMQDYFLKTWYIRVALRITEGFKTKNLRRLGNIKKVSKPHRIIA